MDATLQYIRIKIFLEEEHMKVVPAYNVHRALMISHELLECYNVSKEEQDEEYPRNVQVPKIEGEWVVEEPEIEFVAYTQPKKTQKVNIGMTKNPKFVHIGDYWSDETIEKIVDLLWEYQDLFPMKFSDMKGITRHLGEM